MDGKVAIITGASAGIGRGIAKALAAECVQTVVVARRLKLLESVRDEIVTNGGKEPLVVSADLYDREAPE